MHMSECEGADSVRTRVEGMDGTHSMPMSWYSLARFVLLDYQWTCATHASPGSWWERAKQHGFSESVVTWWKPRGQAAITTRSESVGPSSRDSRRDARTWGTVEL